MKSNGLRVSLVCPDGFSCDVEEMFFDFKQGVISVWCNRSNCSGSGDCEISAFSLNLEKIELVGENYICTIGF